jgi:uncharacterized membrane protein
LAVEAPLQTEGMSKRTTALRRRKVATDHLHPVNQIHIDEATFGERLADNVATVIGSWPFLIVQTILIAMWVIINGVELFIHPWDPYPFILLNLCFSLQAAYTGPILLVAGNRQSQLDRLRLEHTAEVEEASEKMTIEILKEIETNTEATVRILQHIRQQKKGS